MVDSLTGNAKDSRAKARALRNASDLLLAQQRYKEAMDKRLEMLVVHGGSPSLLHALAYYSIQDLALHNLGAIASHLNASPCRRYAAELQAIDAQLPTFATILQNEKTVALKIFDSLSRKPEIWEETLTSLDFRKKSQEELRKLPIAQIRKNIVDWYDLQIHLSKLQFGSTAPFYRNPYTRYITTYQENSRFAWAKSKTQRLMAIVALQIRADRLQKRKRTWLMPRDPFGTGPLKEKNGVLYSIGRDGIDNGGRPAPNSRAPHSTVNTDIVLPLF